MPRETETMTYVTLDIFEKMCRAGGVESKFEYMELYRRGIMPTNLVPRVPSVYYLPVKKDYRHTKLRVRIVKMFEKKYGRKYDPKNKEDRRLYKKIYGQTPEHKEMKKKYRERPEVIAYEKEYRSRPEVKAYRKAYQKRPEVRAKAKAYAHRPENKARAKAYNQSPKYKAKRRAYKQRPEVKAKYRVYRKVYQQRYRERQKQ